MLSNDQKQEITTIVDAALDTAERIWNKHGLALDKALARADEVTKEETVQSRIPEHPLVTGGVEQVDTFIACVIDMRHSSQHLLSAIAGTKASMLERVFYETSALLPALERTIEYRKGAVTEYLGDGVLALFRVDEDDTATCIMSAYRAARDCIGDTRTIVNDALDKRYDLPAVDIGVGLAMSKAVVSLVGLQNSRYAKAVGRCIYFATKLSAGKNEIYVDKSIDEAWPTTKEGKVRTQLRKIRGVDGYLVYESTE